ncbi:MAG: phosphoribosylanthranilate isomerase [Gammaproteobacteria bacterium]|jgi:phosphoribosylanthranilate isomerase
MARIRVKICGITRPEDGVSAALAGADAIGLNFYRPSPRAVGIETALAIVRVLPPFVTRVGLFVDAGRDEITDVLNSIPLDMVQFHGSETPAECDSYAMPYIKAIRMTDGVDLHEQAALYRGAAALLVDAHVAGLAGGTGQTFDWDRIPADLDKPLILAGGLTAENVLQAVSRVRPYAVDVSGGVESSKGIKSRDKIRAFINKVDSYRHE